VIREHYRVICVSGWAAVGLFRAVEGDVDFGRLGDEKCMIGMKVRDEGGLGTEIRVVPLPQIEEKYAVDKHAGVLRMGGCGLFDLAAGSENGDMHVISPLYRIFAC
jgi:hypothetical protein